MNRGAFCKLCDHRRGVLRVGQYHIHIQISDPAAAEPVGAFQAPQGLEAYHVVVDIDRHELGIDIGDIAVERWRKPVRPAQIDDVVSAHGFRRVQQDKFFQTDVLKVYVLLRGEWVVLIHENIERVALYRHPEDFVRDLLDFVFCGENNVHAVVQKVLLCADDVCIKEGQKVVLCPREMPMSQIHIRNMLTAAQAGCIIIPPMLTFYSEYQTVEQQIDPVIGKMLMQFDLKYSGFQPWRGEEEE